jgi:hypothetical protein
MFLSFSVFASASICVSGGGGGSLPEVRNSKAQPKWLPPTDRCFFVLLALPMM